MARGLRVFQFRPVIRVMFKCCVDGLGPWVLSKLYRTRVVSVRFALSRGQPSDWVGYWAGVSGVNSGAIVPDEQYTAYCDIPLSAMKYNKVVRYADSQKGKKYNLFGVIACALTGRCLTWKSSDALFCSEYVAATLREAGLLKNMRPENTLPHDILSALENGGYDVTWPNELEAVTVAVPSQPV